MSSRPSQGEGEGKGKGKEEGEGEGEEEEEEEELAYLCQEGRMIRTFWLGEF